MNNQREQIRRNDVRAPEKPGGGGNAGLRREKRKAGTVEVKRYGVGLLQ